MPNNWSREIPVLELDPELEHTLRIMNQNLGIQGDEVNPQMAPLVDTRDPGLPGICGEGEIRIQPPAPLP